MMDDSRRSKKSLNITTALLASVSMGGRRATRRILEILVRSSRGAKRSVIRRRKLYKWISTGRRKAGYHGTDIPILPSNGNHIRHLRRAIDRVFEPRISCDQWRSSLAWARGGQSSIDCGGYSYTSQGPCLMSTALQAACNEELVSCTLANIFRGKLCGTILSNRSSVTLTRAPSFMTLVATTTNSSSFGKEL